MPDRSSFWSAPPDWSGARLGAVGLVVSAYEPLSAWQLSGEFAPALARLGISGASGPRDSCDGGTYALRLAPDSVLLVTDRLQDPGAGCSMPGLAASELSDGILCIDIDGAHAAWLMACGSEYPFASPPGGAEESARLLFAGLRVAVARRPTGWRLHVERPWAAALWHWLERVIEGEGG